MMSICKNAKSAKHKDIVEEDETDFLWRDFIKGYEHELENGQRCNLCFEYRLNRTFEKAKELGIKEITTTLTISPHKISKNIFDKTLHNVYNYIGFHPNLQEVFTDSEEETKNDLKYGHHL